MPGCGACCAKAYPTWKRKVMAIFPEGPDESRRYMEDGVPRDVHDLTDYASRFTNKLNRIGKELLRRVKDDLKRELYRDVKIGMLAFNALIDNCHNDDTLTYFDRSVITAVALLLQHPLPDAKILATETLYRLMHYQDEHSDFLKFDSLFFHLTEICVYVPGPVLLRGERKLETKTYSEKGKTLYQKRDEAMQHRVQNSVRAAALRSLGKMVVQYDSRTLPTHFPMILPSILVNLPARFPRERVVNAFGDTYDEKDRELVAYDCLKAVAASPNLADVNRLFEPILRHMAELGWEPEQLGLQCMLLIAQESQIASGNLICITLLNNIEVLDRKLPISSQQHGRNARGFEFTRFDPRRRGSKIESKHRVAEVEMMTPLPAARGVAGTLLSSGGRQVHPATPVVPRVSSTGAGASLNRASTRDAHNNNEGHQMLQKSLMDLQNTFNRLIFNRGGRRSVGFVPYAVRGDVAVVKTRMAQVCGQLLRRMRIKLGPWQGVLDMILDRLSDSARLEPAGKWQPLCDALVDCVQALGSKVAIVELPDLLKEISDQVYQQSHRVKVEQERVSAHELLADQSSKKGILDPAGPSKKGIIDQAIGTLSSPLKKRNKSDVEITAGQEGRQRGSTIEGKERKDKDKKEREPKGVKDKERKERKDRKMGDEELTPLPVEHDEVRNRLKRELLRCATLLSSRLQPLSYPYPRKLVLSLLRCVYGETQADIRLTVLDVLQCMLLAPGKAGSFPGEQGRPEQAGKALEALDGAGRARQFLTAISVKDGPKFVPAPTLGERERDLILSLVYSEMTGTSALAVGQYKGKCSQFQEASPAQNMAAAWRLLITLLAQHPALPQELVRHFQMLLTLSGRAKSNGQQWVVNTLLVAHALFTARIYTHISHTSSGVRSAAEKLARLMETVVEKKLPDSVSITLSNLTGIEPKLPKLGAAGTPTGAAETIFQGSHRDSAPKESDFHTNMEKEAKAEFMLGASRDAVLEALKLLCEAGTARTDRERLRAATTESNKTHHNETEDELTFRHLQSNYTPLDPQLFLSFSGPGDSVDVSREPSVSERGRQSRSSNNGPDDGQVDWHEKKERRKDATPTVPTEETKDKKDQKDDSKNNETKRLPSPVSPDASGDITLGISFPNINKQLDCDSNSSDLARLLLSSADYERHIQGAFLSHLGQEEAADVNYETEDAHYSTSYRLEEERARAPMPRWWCHEDKMFLVDAAPSLTAKKEDEQKTSDIQRGGGTPKVATEQKKEKEKVEKQKEIGKDKDKDRVKVVNNSPTERKEEDEATPDALNLRTPSEVLQDSKQRDSTLTEIHVLRTPPPSLIQHDSVFTEAFRVEPTPLIPSLPPGEKEEEEDDDVLATALAYTSGQQQEQKVPSSLSSASKLNREEADVALQEVKSPKITPKLEQGDNSAFAFPQKRTSFTFPGDSDEDEEEEREEREEREQARTGRRSPLKTNNNNGARRDSLEGLGKPRQESVLTRRFPYLQPFESVMDGPDDGRYRSDQLLEMPANGRLHVPRRGLVKAFHSHSHPNVPARPSST